MEEKKFAAYVDYENLVVFEAGSNIGTRYWKNRSAPTESALTRADYIKLAEIGAYSVVTESDARLLMALATPLSAVLPAAVFVTVCGAVAYLFAEGDKHASVRYDLRIQAVDMFKGGDENSAGAVTRHDLLEQGAVALSDADASVVTDAVAMAVELGIVPPFETWGAMLECFNNFCSRIEE
jgi:hypothetical protein